MNPTSRSCAIALLTAVALAACSSVDGSPAPSMSRGAASPTAAITLNAAGHQQLKGHLTPAIANALTTARMPAGDPMTLTLGLAVKDMTALLDAADRVSDPRSSSYRQYVTPKQFADRFGATPAEYQSVLDWARSKKLTVSDHPNRLLATVSGSVADIEAALNVHLFYGKRPDGTRFFAPDTEPSLDLAVPVEHVSGLQNFAPPRRNSGSASDGTYHGDDFRNAYASCTSLTGAGQSIGISDVGSEPFLQSDIDGYGSLTGHHYLPVQSVPPVAAATSAGIETTLDIEMALSMAPDAQIVVFTGATHLGLLGAMAARPDIKQLSSSWTWYDAGTSHQTVMAELAMQGQSFFQSSGDGGAYQPGSFPNTASGTLDDRQLQDITIVGGTTLNMDDKGTEYGTLETTWTDWAGQGGSGGILSGTAIPSYQWTVQGRNGASFTNRNVPDVSAQAETGRIYANGTEQDHGGTSQATPLWAGFMALANQLAAQVGSASVGFANPALYAIAAGAGYGANFNDVVSGCIPNSSNFAYCAAPGYDLATGLGSPQCGLITSLAHAPAPSAAPSCTPSSTCDAEYFPAGYGSPVGDHGIETVTVACGSQPSVLQRYDDSTGTWTDLGNFISNASNPDTTIPNTFAIGSQSSVSPTWGAAAGSVQTVRACASWANGMTCDAPSAVTIGACQITCHPLTCGNGVCGTHADGCGGTINCSTDCGPGATCNANGVCQTHVKTCSTPRECCMQTPDCTWERTGCVCL